MAGDDLVTALIEDTFLLIKELDENDDADDDERERLRRLIADRASSIGEVSSFVLRAIDGTELVACLDEDQARAIQRALLLVEGGTVSSVTPAMSPLTDFVHPDTPAHVVAEALAEP